jgi:hypothetical protein
MFVSNRSASKTRRSIVCLFTLFMIALIVAPMSPVQAEAAGEQARRLVDSAIGLVGESTIPSVIPSLKRHQDFSAERVQQGGPGGDGAKYFHSHLAILDRKGKRHSFAEAFCN